jgi:1-acyl-sn-glycerol-3-phosphate acyltransferase
MKRVQQLFWYYYFCLTFGISFPVLFPVQWVLLQKKNWYPAAHRYRSFWARLILRTWGVHYQLINPEYINENHPVIICSNHSSFLDIIVCCAVFKSHTSFMAKAELSNIPLFGIFFKTIDIEVNRLSGEKSATAYRKAVKALEAGQNIIIYPEGGIFPDPLTIKPFKEGAFQLSLRHNIPILPVVFPDNYKIMPDQKRSAKPGKIRVILHPPLLTVGLKISDMELLKDKLNNILQKDILS